MAKSEIPAAKSVSEITDINVLIKWIHDNMDENDTISAEWNQIRTNLSILYPVFVFFYAIVACFGTLSNVCLFWIIVRRQLFYDPTHFFIGSLAISDIIKTTLVLPITLSNILLRNWILGSFLCYFLPMLQSFPIHVSMLTFVIIAVDRYRLILYPMKPRVPAGLCTIAAWGISVCLVLPIAVYFRFINIGDLLPEYDGFGICYIRIGENYAEFVRAIFVTMYAVPLAVIAFLHIKVSAELKTQISTFANSNGRQEERCSNGDDAYNHHQGTWSSITQNEPESTSIASAHKQDMCTTEDQVSNQNEDELDIYKEKRNQQYMISMVTVFGFCWCPLHIMALVVPFVGEETEEKENFMDITYITFSWLGFLATCTNPVLYASWKMSDRTKDRLRGYLNFSNRCRTVFTGRTNSPSVREHNNLKVST
ncbi:neuropeptide Y receptor type 2-like [Tubulanus polymorphus]|uniref:neuropeptide Y receptor type 2-like n=1 Tax=Tubulanus polymorphus TaxID=672921 RepID=UPI003DA413DF